MTELTPASLGFRMPAEWEPHEATWIAWPHNATDWPGKGLMVQWVFVEMTRLLHHGERVRIVVRNRAQQKHARQLLRRSRVDMARVDFFLAKTDRSWTRDFLPTFVVAGGNPGARQIGAVKWKFNGWARYVNWKRDDAAGEAIAKRYADVTWHPIHTAAPKPKRVVLEGGAIDVDGQGTLLATEQCLLTGLRARNGALGRAGTERVFAHALGVKKVLWLPDGIAGDDTSGHIDDFARFVAPGRVVLCREPNKRDANHRVLERAWKSLRSARDAKGRRVELIPLPMPDPVAFGPQRLPASYANFYIGNGVVLVPTFNDVHDGEVLALFRELFPKREVVGVHCRDLVLGLGTLHCSTQQEPR
jgi:agmatine deiminase